MRFVRKEGENIVAGAKNAICGVFTFCKSDRCQNAQILRVRHERMLYSISSVLAKKYFSVFFQVQTHLHYLLMLLSIYKFSCVHWRIILVTEREIAVISVMSTEKEDPSSTKNADKETYFCVNPSLYLVFFLLTLSAARMWPY